MSQDIFNIKTLGEVMRPENLRGEAFRFSREERDHVAGHALTAVCALAIDLAYFTRSTEERSQSLPQASMDGSDAARKIGALSNLLGDIGWERERNECSEGNETQDGGAVLGELFPVAQLRPWLEEWQRRDNEALKRAEGVVETESGHWEGITEYEGRKDLADAQTKLGTGAILLARIEKWMASHEN